MPFLSIIKAYMEGRLTKVECQKSNYQIIKLIRLYNPATKKFKFSEGNEHEITSNDVSDIFGLPNKGNKLPSTTTSTRTNLAFEKKYFEKSKKITKTEIDRCLNTAIADDGKKNAMDVVRLLILELFITNLFCNSRATMAWTFFTMIDTLEVMNSYNWAQGVLDYTHYGLDQAIKNKKDKTNQPSVSGCLVLILIKAVDNEKEEATKTDHADHEEQEENEEDDDFVITLKDWLKSQTQKGKKQTVITQKQNFSFHENVDQSATQTKTPQHEQNEDNAQSLGCKADDEIEEPPAQSLECEADDEIEEQAVDLSVDSMTEDTVNVQQQNPELDSQEEDFDAIFVDIVGSIPKYYKHEIAPTYEKIQQLKKAVDYWIEKADTRRDMMQTAIESCIKKNSFIQQIWTEKEELEQQIEILKKQLQQEKKEGAKLQGELHALKSNRRQLQEKHELLEGKKLSCIESMKEKDIIIASLQHVMGKKFKECEQGEISMKEQADKEKKEEERIAEESELEMQESPNDEDENADEKTPEKDAFYLHNRKILYKHNIEKLMGDGPIFTLIIDAYGEALNDDAKQNPHKQKNAYLSANNYMFLRGASHKLTYHAFYMPLLENIGRVDRVFIPITDENHHTLLVFDTGAAKWTHFNSFRGTSEQTLQYYYKKAIVLVETTNIFLCLLKECATVSLKTKLVQILDFDAKKPRSQEGLMKLQLE
ncbi:unnamed protein product [Prunus armeniaca]